MTLSNDGALMAIFEPFYGNRGRGDRIEVWDVRAGKQVDSIATAWRAPLGFSPSAQQLVATVDFEIELRDYGDVAATSPRKFKPLRVLDSKTLAFRDEPSDSGERVQFVATPRGGTNFLVGGPDFVSVWDAATLSPQWTLWDSSASVARSKEKVWGSILLGLVSGCFGWLLRKVRQQNHRCCACGQAFVPTTQEDWALGCSACRAARRVSEAKIVRWRQAKRHMRLIAAGMLLFALISLGAAAYFCQRIGLAHPIFNLVGGSLAMLFSINFAGWCSLLLYPRSAEKAVAQTSKAIRGVVREGS